MELYRERLTPSWWLILAIGLVLPATILIFLPLSITVGVGAGVVLWAGAVAVLWAFSPTVTVEENHFRAGAARVEWEWVERIDAIGADNQRAEKGVNLDARAWLVLRPWITPAIKVVLSDPRDPTPYWLVSTRNPDDIIEAWQRATAAQGD